jgi:hypothetical protein
MKYDQLRDNIIDIFNAMSFSYKMYNADGKSESNPYNARYFFVDNPNIMLILDDNNNTIEFHRSNFNFELFKKILKMLRNITKKYFVKLHVSTYNKSITPKTFSREVLRKKTQRNNVVEHRKYNQGIDFPHKSGIVNEHNLGCMDIAYTSYANNNITESTLDDIVYIINHMYLNEEKVNHLLKRLY